eukprot:c17669_g1_i1.p1 GENE.c17669_g1_i1~~c17669_g1_i1.p1  ORF type:complete len:432 (+),score=108.10 c17669_g1_i1:622-1917(+)
MLNSVPPTQLEDFRTRDDSRRTLLMLAAASGHLALVEMLVGKFRANLELEDTNGRTALWWACANGFTDVVQYLVCSGHAMVCNSSDPPLAAAMLNSQTDVVRFFIKEEPTTLCEYLYPSIDATPFALACREAGLAPILELLLKSENNQLRAHLASQLLHGFGVVCAAGDVDKVRLFLNHQPTRDLLRSNKSDAKSAFDLALLRQHTGVVKLLLADELTDPTKIEFDLVSIVRDAASQNTVGVLKAVLLHAQPSLALPDVRMALRGLAEHREQAVKVVLVFADWSQVTQLSALQLQDLFRDRRNLRKFSTVSDMILRNWTQLMFASQLGDEDLIRCCLQRGENPSFTNVFRESPMSVCVEEAARSLLGLAVREWVPDRCGLWPRHLRQHAKLFCLINSRLKCGESRFGVPALHGNAVSCVIAKIAQALRYPQ